MFESTAMETFRFVFRIQDSDGRGPYQKELIKSLFDTGVSILNPIFSASYIWSDSVHNTTNGKPKPLNDQGFDDIALALLSSDIGANLKFGFESMKQLQSWFSVTELSNLEKIGFYINSVKAKRIWSSGKQAFYEEGTNEDSVE